VVGDYGGHGPLSPGAAIPTLFLPTVILGFRQFELGLAFVHILGIAAPGDSGLKPLWVPQIEMRIEAMFTPNQPSECVDPSGNETKDQTKKKQLVWGRNPNVTVGRNSVKIAATGNSGP
jgi:hypothetical protein